MKLTPEDSFSFLDLGRRRSLLGAAVLSASAVAILAGRDALAAQGAKSSAGNSEADARILNTALGAELEQ